MACNTVHNNTNILEGSFFQPDLMASWTAGQMLTEFTYMKTVKMDHVIWQWTSDTTFPPAAGMYTYYPSNVTGFTQVNSEDAVGISLAQAKAAGLQVWLGLNWSNDWWSKGTLDQTWLDQQFGWSMQFASELWSMYSRYRTTIAGFYLTFEVDNSYDATAQSVITASYTSAVNYIHNATGKKVMVAPFFLDATANPTGLTPSQYATMWGNIITSAAIDVVAIQDGIGSNHATVADVGSWLSPLRNAIKAARPSTEVWCDLETLNSDFTPAAVSRVITQLQAEQPYVDKFTTFSFNHYDSPQQGHGTPQYVDWTAYSNLH